MWGWWLRFLYPKQAAPVIPMPITKVNSMVNKVNFYACIRSKGLFKDLTQKQVDTIDALFFEAEKQGLTLPQLAYCFATSYHECYNWNDPSTRMTPMNEVGGDKYLKGKKYYPYFGRGLSHITWPENYKKEAKRLGIDLVKNPELMNDIYTASNSHIYCMKNGTYTGKKLSDYINENKTDFINARRIINGLDRAADIALYADKFLGCLTHQN